MKVTFEAEQIRNKTTIALNKADWNIEEVEDMYVITPVKELNKTKNPSNQILTYLPS